MKVINSNRRFKDVNYIISNIQEGVVKVRLLENTEITFLNMYTGLDIEDRVVPVVEEYIERFILN